MPYPFENNPLDSYLVKRRQFKEQEFLRSMKQIAKPKAMLPALKMHPLSTVHDELLALDRLFEIPHRTFDVFLSPRELEINAFLKANPKPQLARCLHPNFEHRCGVMRNGAQHVETQCLECGLTLKRHRKVDFPDWESMPVADTALRDRFYKPTTEWYQKSAAMHEALPPANNRPSFDFAQFTERHLKDHPSPVSPHTCSHAETELTLRIYQNGSCQAVYQCVECGKHVRATQKNQVDDIQNLSLFNESKRLSAEKAVGLWHRKHSEATEKARQAFYEATAAAITTG